MIHYIGVPATPDNFSKITTTSTSITMPWDCNSGGANGQKFYIQYKVQGFYDWTTVSVGEEGIIEPKGRREYQVKNLQEGETYELRIFSENTAGKRSSFTRSWFACTESSSTQCTCNELLFAVCLMQFTFMY